ncbi:hypothetical protein BKA70DRAFT_1439480 [Coprinopsis sp. MPI-PUGE-AT-0042]|nr:hypothetical protein BKA70DRAFT_1439480 [Coprinopsis sp. MPI-PUGE-AT-0042]
MTLNAQDGKRIGMEVALELSGIAILRMRLTERKVSLKDTRSDVLDAFKQEFDCLREEGARFMTRSERLEEARKKAEQEADENEKQRLVRETERREEAEKELKRRAEEERRNMPQAKEAEMLNSAEVPTPSSKKKADKKVRRVVKQEEAKEPKLEQECAKPWSAGDAQRLEGERPDSSEKEITERVENENAKRLEEEEYEWW